MEFTLPVRTRDVAPSSSIQAPPPATHNLGSDMPALALEAQQESTTGHGPAENQQAVALPAPVYHHTINPHTSQFRSLSVSADEELLAYLHRRRISPNTLIEIDRVLAAHPDIAYHKSEFRDEINYATPLDAYLYCMIGYTRPAIYNDGTLPGPYRIPFIHHIQPPQEMHDPELRDIYMSSVTRQRLLMKMDDEVKGIAMAVYRNEDVPLKARQLVVYAWFGNLVDAVKYYEYEYQNQYRPKGYVYEHSILEQISESG